MSENCNTGDKLLYFIIGGFVGAAIGMLFAPKSGEETRAYLANRARESADYLAQQKKTLEDRAASMVEQGKDLLTRQRESIAAAIEAGKQAYKEEAGRPES